MAHALLQQMNSELSDFLRHLRESKQLTEKDLRAIFAPLNSNSSGKRTAGLLLVVALAICALYFLSHVETISWHLSAVARIALIKTLPLWDWTGLKNERCLIENWKSEVKFDGGGFNCDLCEDQDVTQLGFYGNPDEVSEDLFKKRHLDAHLPLIIENGIADWVQDYRKLIAEIVAFDEISSSTPCHLKTNIFPDLTSLGDILNRLQFFPKFFIHFQNCDLGAMKFFRKFTPRPRFLPPNLSPSQYNWLLLSKNYSACTNFKKLEGLIEPFTVFGQISGRHIIRLIPRGGCEAACSMWEFEIKAGQALVFTSLWDLVYKSVEDLNFAAVLEYR